MANPSFWRVDEFVKTAQGVAAAGAQVFLTTQPSNTSVFPPTPLALLFADPLGVTPLTQPLIADGFGHVFAYVAGGTYTLTVAYGSVIQQVFADQSYGLGGGSEGSTVQVNGAEQDLANFNSIAPAAPANNANVTFQVDVNGNITAYAPTPTQFSGAIVPTAGSASPTPVFGFQQAPTTINPSIYVQDTNGNWHAQAGIDTTTSPVGNTATNPDGTLTFLRRTYFRDTQKSTQVKKNAFVSFNHIAGVGTADNNQDAMLGGSMWNNSGNIGSFSILNGVVTFTYTSNSWSYGTSLFLPGQKVIPSGMAVGTYLNAQLLTVLTYTVLSGSSFQLTASFAHADVTVTSDSGKLEQSFQSMAGIQLEMDLVGAPTFEAAVDGEVSSASFQISDNHVGAIDGPQYGINCVRASYFRQTGTWTSVTDFGSCYHAQFVNNATDNAQGTQFSNFLSTAGDFGPSPSLWFSGFKALTPSPRFSLQNVGFYAQNYGTNGADWAIRVDGAKDASACLLSGPVVLNTHGVLRTARANATAPGNTDAAGQLVYATATTASYVFTETYSVAPCVFIQPNVPGVVLFTITAISTTGFTVTASAPFTGTVSYFTVGLN